MHHGVVSVDNQMFSVDYAYKGHLVDAFVDDTTIQVWHQNHLIKTVARVRKGPVRKLSSRWSTRKRSAGAKKGNDQPELDRPTTALQISARYEFQSVQMGAATIRCSSGNVRGPVCSTTPALKRSPSLSRNHTRCRAASRRGAAAALTSIPITWRASNSPIRFTSWRPCSCLM